MCSRLEGGRFSSEQRKTETIRWACGAGHVPFLWHSFDGWADVPFVWHGIGGLQTEAGVHAGGDFCFSGIRELALFYWLAM